MYEPNQDYSPMGAQVSEVSERDVAVYLSKVMGWMCVGLLTTVAAAMVFLSVPALFVPVLSSRYGMYAILFAQLGVVFAFSGMFHKLSPSAATVLFMAYSALTGVTFSVLYFIFELSSIVSVFGLAAVLFLAMCLYGFATKRDLSRVGSIAVMGLIAVILASVANIFLRSSGLDLVVSIVGLIVFIALTAYDLQKIKNAYLAQASATTTGYEVEITEVQDQKLAIYGAFQLYLDFINIFLYLLRLLGKRSR